MVGCILEGLTLLLTPILTHMYVRAQDLKNASNQKTDYFPNLGGEGHLTENQLSNKILDLDVSRGGGFLFSLYFQKYVFSQN